MSSRVLEFVAGAAVVAVAVVGLPPAGRCADLEVAPRPAQSRSVEISITGSDRARAVLEGAIAPLVRSDSRITWSRSPAQEVDRPAPGVSRLTVDAADHGTVKIVAFIAERPPAARSIQAPALDPVTTEVVAQIVGATARALLAGAPVFTEEGAPTATNPAPFALPASAGAPAGGLATPAGVAAASHVAAPVQARAVVVSAGYLVRSVFRSVTPLAQGAAVRVAVLPATAREPARPFVAFSLEYHQVNVPELSRGNSALDLEYRGGAAQALAGFVRRPHPFVEIGGGLGLGLMYTTTGSEPYGHGWFPVGRALASAAIGSPQGLALTVAITVDAVPHGGYNPVTAAISPEFVYPTPSWFQPGALLTLGWRG